MIYAYFEQGLNDFRVVQKRNGPLRDVKALCNYDDKVINTSFIDIILLVFLQIYIMKYTWAKPFRIFFVTLLLIMHSMYFKHVYTGGSMTLSRGETYVDIWTCGKEGNNSKIKETISSFYVFHNFFQLVYLLISIYFSDISEDGNTIILSSSRNTTAYLLNSKNKYLSQKFGLYYNLKI
uniref:7TM_GPCR_Srx domain-containing protein n=1 Tax=Heterorhabditis bacteriophora TaxID=37862 RepID=A0A1I7WKM1_HETBA